MRMVAIMALAKPAAIAKCNFDVASSTEQGREYFPSLFFYIYVSILQ
jgi:hypothetical protein